jgi:hypothetical protein
MKIELKCDSWKTCSLQWKTDKFLEVLKLQQTSPSWVAEPQVRNLQVCSISVFHSDRFLQEVLLIIEDMESRGLDIIYYFKFSSILDDLDHHHHHGDCYGVIADCNGRQIFPGRAQLIATNFYMLSCSASDQESGMMSLYSILWSIPARLAHYWRHGMLRTGYYISLVGSLMMSFIIMEIAACIW